MRNWREIKNFIRAISGRILNSFGGQNKIRINYIKTEKYDKVQRDAVLYDEIQHNTEQRNATQ